MGKFPHEVDEMPASDFMDFLVFDRMEPAGDRLVGSTIANVNRDSHSDVFLPEEFHTAIIDEGEIANRRAERIISTLTAAAPQHDD